MLLEPKPLILMNAVWMSQEVGRCVDGGLSAFELRRFTTMASKEVHL